MADSEEIKPRDNIQAHLKEVQDLLQRRALAEAGGPSPEAAQEAVQAEVAGQAEQVAELTRKLDALHPADIAYILEALPLDERLFVWDLVRAERDGDILLEVSDAVRESLIETMAHHELTAAAGQLDADELADLAPDLPDAVMEDVYLALDM